MSMAQNTCTSTMNGNATSPSTWSCVPAGFVPLPGDDVIVNHDVVLDNDWAYSSGSLLINTGASLTGDIPGRVVWVDGGTFTNHGTFNVARVGTNSGVIINNGTMDVTSYYNASVNATNNGIIVNADSVWNNGVLYSSGSASITTNNFWNSNSMANDGVMVVNNFLNTGEMTSTNDVTAGFFASSGDYTNTGIMYVSGHMANWEIFDNGGTGYIHVDGDFWNGDSVSNIAHFTNDGFLRVMNDWYNTDTIIGVGVMCVGNVSINGDYLGGTQDFCDQTGGGVDINTGTIAGTVSFCTGNCFLSIDEQLELVDMVVAPNPANDQFTITAKKHMTDVVILDAMGREVSLEVDLTGNGAVINRSGVESGVYFIRVGFSDGTVATGSVVFN